LSVQIHAAAIVEDGAELGEDVVIGPWCFVSSKAVLGDGVKLANNVTIQGRTSLGARTTVAPFAVLGGAPQITPYKDTDSSLEIGVDCTIREHVTLHRGSTRGEERTVIGDRCFLMDSAHVGHDCYVGAGSILARGATLGGHCILGEQVYLGGLSAVHQWTRVGRQAFIGGLAAVTRDIVPFALANGNPTKLNGLNITGFKRRGFASDQIRDLLAAFDLIFSDDGNNTSIKERLMEVADIYKHRPEVMEIVEFARGESKRGLCTTR
jgi:UDP-N-acetylglucosamine acyltransferase